MVLEPGGGLSFPPPPGAGGNGSTAGSLIGPVRLFQRTTPVFPFHVAGWSPHHSVLGQVQSLSQQSMQMQHQVAATTRFISHHLPHHSLPALGSHPLVPGLSIHHSAHHLHHNVDHAEDDDDKKGTSVNLCQVSGKIFLLLFMTISILIVMKFTRDH